MATNKQSLIGLGDPSALLKVYMANRPNHPFINANAPAYKGIIPVEKNELYECGQACGNGWRKVFNVYAKLIFALSNEHFGNFIHYAKWQEYRDELLLKANSNAALLFSEPDLAPQDIKTDSLHLIMGKTYAMTLLNKNLLGNPHDITWLNSEFAINTKRRLIICPYFDYRQLSNIKILYLIGLVQSHFFSNQA